MRISQNVIVYGGITAVIFTLAFLNLSGCTQEVLPPETTPNAEQEALSEQPLRSSAQTEIINFPSGTPIITIPGQIIGSSYKQYVLKGTEGQLLTIFTNAEPPGVEVSVVAQDGAVLDLFRSGYAYSKELEVSQNYYLNVTPLAGASNTEFTISVFLTNSEQTDDLQRINFSQDATAYKVNGKLSPNSSKTYVFNAVQGQNLSIDAAPSDSGITVSVRAPDGSMLGWVPAGMHLSEVIPISQEYFIDLVLPNNAGEINYEMVVSLQ